MVKVSNRVSNRNARTKAKANAYLTKSKGKAIRNQSKLRETELTKRSLARSAALSNAASNIAKAQSRQAVQNQSTTKPWNDIINNVGGSTVENEGTSNNTTESTTTTDRRS